MKKMVEPNLVNMLHSRHTLDMIKNNQIKNDLIREKNQ